MNKPLRLCQASHNSAESVQDHGETHPETAVLSTSHLENEVWVSFNHDARGTNAGRSAHALRAPMTCQKFDHPRACKLLPSGIFCQPSIPADCFTHGVAERQ
jgi:hypothetical protein